MGQQNRTHHPLVPLLCVLGILQMLTWTCAQKLESLEDISLSGAESPPLHAFHSTMPSTSVLVMLTHKLLI